MSRQILFRVPLILAALLILAAPSALAQPRAVPPGDSRDAPILIAINSSKTVKGVEGATLETPDVEDTSCDASDISNHSVWFRFVLDYDAVLDLDTGGTLLNYNGIMDTNVVLSLYKTFIGAVETNCASGKGARLTGLNLQRGDYLVRVATNINTTLLSPAQYRLSIRARTMKQLIYDEGFELNPFGVPWKVKHAGSPASITRVCAPCYANFAGGPGKLQTTLKFDAAEFRFVKGDLLFAEMYVNGTPVSGADVKLALQVNYSDGTPPTKSTAAHHVIQTSTVAGTTSITGGILIEIASKTVSSIKITISGPTAGQSFRVQSTDLLMYAGGSARALPLPPSP